MRDAALWCLRPEKRALDETETLTRLGLALAIGFLIGVERGWREREEKEGERAAGLRTFALTGLFGGVWGLLTREIGPAPMGLAFLALAGAATLFRWRETEREGTYGMTTLVAAFLTFSLGALAVLGDMVAAAAAGVATAALLAAKEWLHSWLKVLTWPELRAALILLAMSFVALPVLPDRGYGPYEALNPYQLWVMTIVIAGVSFIGYVATKVAGERYGSLIAGIAGGLVSSTAVTLDFARRTRAAPALWRPYLSGGLAASTVMFARVIVIVVLFGPGLAGAVVPALAAAAVVSAMAALGLNRSFAAGGRGRARAATRWCGTPSSSAPSSASPRSLPRSSSSPASSRNISAARAASRSRPSPGSPTSTPSPCR